jgi:long-subunit fatty acid transport protein
MKQLSIMAIILFFTINLYGALMNIPGSYGLAPDEIGSSRAFSLFSDGFSSAYFNPAGLAQRDNSQISLGYIYAKPQLKLNDNVAFSEPNEVGILGLKIDLGNAITFDKNLSLGIILGVDKNFSGLLTIADRPSESGQFIRYGRGQMLLITSLGVEPYRGIYAGGGAYISVKSDATVLLDTTLSGKTENESIELNGKTGLTPILGLLFSPGETFDSRKLKVISFGIAYMGKSEYTVRVKTNAVATIGGSPLATLPLDLIFLDAFVPQQLRFGLKVKPLLDLEGLAFGIEGSYLFWNELDSIITKKDAVKNELNLDFKNIFVPSLGCEWSGKNGLSLRTGYSYEASPLSSAESGRANLVDAARHIIGIGAGYTFNKVSGLKNPLSIGTGYQLHILSKKKFTLESEDGSKTDAETGGFLNSFGISLTMRF